MRLLIGADFNRVPDLGRVNDVRDGGQASRLHAVAGDAGCHSCHTMMSCTELCPKELSPTRSIAGLKRATLGVALSSQEEDK